MDFGTKVDSIYTSSESHATAHLLQPKLRLVYLPLCLQVTFLHVPDVPEKHCLTFFVGISMAAHTIVSSILDEYGLRRSLQEGTKTANIQYALRIGDTFVSDRMTFQEMVTHFRLRGPPFACDVTLSSEWLAKIGTLASALTTPASTNSPARTSVLARDQPTSRSSWRPSSIFGYLTTSTSPGTIEEEEDTVKLASPASRSPPIPSTSARLSQFFDTWLSSEDTVQRKQRTVSNPLPDFAAPKQGFGVTAREVEQLADATEALDIEFEQLMAELGMKEGPQKTAMLQLSDARKRYLIEQQRQLNVHRSPITDSQAGWTSRRASFADTGGKHSPTPSISSTFTVSVPPTASGWASWFNYSSSANSSLPVSAGDKKMTAAAVVQQLRSEKISSKNLAKLLIALRVQLSTESLGWITDFVQPEQDGIMAIQQILQRFCQPVRKGDNDEMLLLEGVRCLRILLNTEVRSRLGI